MHAESLSSLPSPSSSSVTTSSSPSTPSSPSVTTSSNSILSTSSTSPSLTSSSLLAPKKICFLPDDPSKSCFSSSELVSSLTSQIPSLYDRIILQTEPSEDTDAIFWLPNLAAGNVASQLSKILEAARNVKMVQLPMTGVDDYLDLIRGSKDRITWCCSKGCYSDSVAEHVLALILTFFRGTHLILPPANTAVRTLFNAAVLVVGNGSISESVRRILSPFSCKIFATSSSTSDQTFVDELKLADIAVLACPLTERTGGMFNTAKFKLMKEDSVLINVARGEIVESIDLITALEKGVFGAAGLDVFTWPKDPSEKKMLDARIDLLKTKGKLIITPHAALPIPVMKHMLMQRIVHNVQVLAENEEASAFLHGKVDPEKGY